MDSDHVPIQAIFNDKRANAKQLTRVPKWVGSEPRFRVLFKARLDELETLQGPDASPYVNLALYKEALRYAWRT